MAFAVDDADERQAISLCQVRNASLFRAGERKPNMIQASCHCGAVELQVASAPSEVTECSCSICRRYGVLWAYYARAEVAVFGSTDQYLWNDRCISFHRCKSCGCVTHWWPQDDHDRVGVNARLMDPAILQAARVRHLDGAGTEQYLD